MSERRRQPRKTLMSYTQVFDLYGGTLIGYLGDLNLLGIMAIGDRPMDIDTRLTLAIELPDLPDVKATRMTIAARVAWSQQDISPQFYNIGFEFLELTPEQTKIIEKVLDKYYFRRDGPSFFVKPVVGS